MFGTNCSLSSLDTGPRLKEIAMYRRTLSLSPADRNCLTDHRDHDRRPDVRERCAAILKVADGRSAHFMAREGLLKPRDPDTIYSWMDRFEEQGVEGLIECQQGGNHRQPFR
jgi:hypothetical protein